MRSQIATASKRNIRFRPVAFTEHGAIMAANVLNSTRAVQMSVFVVRAFLKMRVFGVEKVGGRSNLGRGEGPNNRPPSQEPPSALFFGA